MISRAVASIRQGGQTPLLNFESSYGPGNVIAVVFLTKLYLVQFSVILKFSFCYLKDWQRLRKTFIANFSKKNVGSKVVS